MNDQTIRDTHEQAIQALTALEERLYCDIDLIDTMSVSETHEELLTLGLDPTKQLVDSSSDDGLPLDSVQRKSDDEIPPAIPSHDRVVDWLADKFQLSIWSRLSKEFKIDAAVGYDVEPVPYESWMSLIAEAAIGEDWGQFRPKSVLCEMIDQNIAGVRRYIDGLQERHSRSQTLFETIHTILHTFLDADSENKKRKRLSPLLVAIHRRPELLTLVATLTSMVVGIITAPRPKLLFSLLSVGLTVMGVVCLVGFFMLINKHEFAKMFSRLDNLIIATGSAFIGCGLALLVGLAFGFGHAFLTTALFGIGISLTMLAGEGFASFVLQGLPNQLNKALEEGRKKQDDTKQRIALAEKALKALLAARNWVVAERDPQVDPVVFMTDNYRWR